MEVYLPQMIHIGSRKKQENLTIPAENVPPRPGTPTLQGPTPSTAPAGPILLKFWLKTRKSILNKVTKYQIPTSNRSAARIEKPTGGWNLPPQRIGLTRAPLGYFYNAPHWGGGAISSPPP